MIGQPSSVGLSPAHVAVPSGGEGDARPRFDGWIDEVQAGSVFGWATDRGNPSSPAHLLFAFGRRIVGVGVADEDRADVAQALGISLRCGFRHLLPLEVLKDPAAITVLAVDAEVAKAVASMAEGRGDRALDDVIGTFGQGRVHALAASPGALSSLSVPRDEVDVLAQASAARDAGNWASAAFFYGEAAARNPDSFDLRMRHGDMLRRAGLLEKAKVSYEHARRLSPTDVEPITALASLAMARGRLQDAIQHLKVSLDTGISKGAAITRELDALRSSGVQKTSRGKQSSIVFYLSSIANAAPDGDAGALKSFLGHAHYSYSYILRGYLLALENAGFECRIIKHPEYQPDIRTREEGKVVHIGFYPPEEPRFLKGAFNITCLAWEFERLRTTAENLSYHAFSDAALMLNRSDEVWAISEFGAEALERSGVGAVRAVPSPVPVGRALARRDRPSFNQILKSAAKLDRLRWFPLAIFPGMQDKLSRQSNHGGRSLSDVFFAHDMDEAPIVLYYVFNVHDYRKQVRPLLEAFVRFAQVHRNAYLLLKVTSVDAETSDMNTQILEHQILEPSDLISPLVSDRVLFTANTLSRDEMTAMSELSAYYICTPHAEGQNLPLIEAMSAGAVPISVNHTAMRDYISPENAIVVPSTLGLMTPRLTFRYGIYGTKTYYVDVRDIYKALRAAFDQTAEQYADMSRAAVQTASKLFGTEPFLASLRACLDEAHIQIEARN